MNQEDTSPDSITLSEQEVSILLGLDSESGIAIGEVRSGSQGVTVESIRWDDEKGRDVELSDLQLTIVSDGELSYRINSMSVSELDFHDWEAGLRTQLHSLSVANPGPAFLGKLEEAILAIKDRSIIKTKGLDFEELRISSLSQVFKPRDGSVFTVTAKGLSIEGAGESQFGKFAIDEIKIADVAALKSFSVTKVDRAWIDGIIAAVSEGRSFAEIGELAHLSDRILPFDQIQVEQIDIHLDGEFGPMILDDLVVEISELKLAVSRDRAESFAGVTGQFVATMDLPTDVPLITPADLEDDLEDARNVRLRKGYESLWQQIRDMTKSRLVARASVSLVKQPDGVEQGSVQVVVDELGRIEVDGRMHQASPYFQWLVNRGELPDFDRFELFSGRLLLRFPVGFVSTPFFASFGSEEDAYKPMLRFSEDRRTELLDLEVSLKENPESINFALRVPRYGAITATAVTQEISPISSRYIELEEEGIDEEKWDQELQKLRVKAVDVCFKDEGFAAALFSDNAVLRDNVGKTPGQWAGGSQKARLASEVNAFIRRPDSVTFEAQAKDFMPFGDFFEAVSEFVSTGKQAGVLVMLEFKGR